MNYKSFILYSNNRNVHTAVLDDVNIQAEQPVSTLNQSQLYYLNIDSKLLKFTMHQGIVYLRRNIKL